MIFGRRYESFSVEVRVENRQRESVEGAPIGVRVRVWVRVRRLFQRNKEDSAIEGRRTSFEGTVQEGNTALLSWEAKSETNLVIEFVEGAGTTKNVGGAGFEPATPCL